MTYAKFFDESTKSMRYLLAATTLMGASLTMNACALGGPSSSSHTKNADNSLWAHKTLSSFELLLQKDDNQLGFESFGEENRTFEIREGEVYIDGNMELTMHESAPTYGSGIGFKISYKEYTYESEDSMDGTGLEIEIEKTGSTNFAMKLESLLESDWKWKGDSQKKLFNFEGDSGKRSLIVFDSHQSEVSAEIRNLDDLYTMDKTIKFSIYRLPGTKTEPGHRIAPRTPLSKTYERTDEQQQSHALPVTISVGSFNPDASEAGSGNQCQAPSLYDDTVPYVLPFGIACTGKNNSETWADFAPFYAFTSVPVDSEDPDGTLNQILPATLETATTTMTNAFRDFLETSWGSFAKNSELLSNSKCLIVASWYRHPQTGDWEDLVVRPGILVFEQPRFSDGFGEKVKNYYLETPTGQRAPLLANSTAEVPRMHPSYIEVLSYGEHPDAVLPVVDGDVNLQGTTSATHTFTKDEKRLIAEAYERWHLEEASVDATEVTGLDGISWTKIGVTSQ